MEHPIGHALSLATIIGSIAGFLPPIAALVSIIYYSLLIINELRRK